MVKDAVFDRHFGPVALCAPGVSIALHCLDQARAFWGDYQFAASVARPQGPPDQFQPDLNIAFARVGFDAGFSEQIHGAFAGFAVPLGPGRVAIGGRHALRAAGGALFDQLGVV